MVIILEEINTEIRILTVFNKLLKLKDFLHLGIFIFTFLLNLVLTL